MVYGNPVSPLSAMVASTALTLLNGPLYPHPNPATTFPSLGAGAPFSLVKLKAIKTLVTSLLPNNLPQELDMLLHDRAGAAMEVVVIVEDTKANPPVTVLSRVTLVSGA